MKVRNLADLRAILGCANFYRRHLRDFTSTTSRLTDKLKKDSVWSWTSEDQKLLEELKFKMSNPSVLGVPRREGEIVLISDASDLGGGSLLFQFQDLEEGEIPKQCRVDGMNPDGTLKHNYPSSCRLVPLGNFNWKWNEARSKYDVYQRELLAGILTLGSQFRIVSGLPIIWLCDNQATKTFLDGPPPMNPRLRRWYTFLSQFRLSFLHVPGSKNEMCDYLSRNCFDEKVGIQMDILAKEAFARMDSQLDLCMKQLFFLNTDGLLSENDFLDSEFDEVWRKLQPYQAELFQENLFYKTESTLFCERLVVVPEKKLQDILQFCHVNNGHPGPEKTLLFFLKYFWSDKSKTDLMLLCKKLFQGCEICLRSKPNNQGDRGLISCLPIPQMSNELLYIYSISMDQFNGIDYVLTIVDALSRFVRFIPCKKNITGEGTLKLILQE
jgi:hypothetical protein